MKKTSGEELLLDLILSAKDHESLKLLLSEIFTAGELAALIQRVSTTKAILDGLTYRQIHDVIGSSTYIISRAKQEIVGSKKQYVVRYFSSHESLK